MKTTTLAALSLTFITSALTLAPLHSTEPSYHNKKLTVWLGKLDSLDPDEWRQGAEAVRALGTNALPTLAKRLRAKDSLIRRKLIDVCETYPIVVVLPAEAHYESALEACRILGPAASPLIPEIICFLGDDRRTKAVKVLIAVGESSVRPLTRVLASEDEQARAGAAVALGSIARQAQTVVAALRDHLDDSSPETRMTVAWALGRFGVQASPALPEISRLTNDPAFIVREQAVRAIDRIVQQHHAALH